MIKNKLLLENGFIIVDFPLPPSVLVFIQNEKWRELDHYFLEISQENGVLKNFLSDYLDFQTLEHIIAIRSDFLDDYADEDGIWHDDGSRFLGFSLSLNFNPSSIEGGALRFRKKQSLTENNFPPLPYGQIVLFLSGIFGYEHMVSAVTKGRRIVIAGWCS